MSVARAGRRPPRGEFAKHQLLGRSSAREHGDLVFQIAARHQVTVFGRALQGVAKAPMPRGMMEILCTGSVPEAPAPPAHGPSRDRPRSRAP